MSITERSSASSREASAATLGDSIASLMVSRERETHSRSLRVFNPAFQVRLGGLPMFPIVLSEKSITHIMDGLFQLI